MQVGIDSFAAAYTETSQKISASQRLLPGTVALVQPGRVHAGRNTSRTTPFKFVLIRLHVKGEPMSVELE